MQLLDVAQKLEENRELTVEFYLTVLELDDLKERCGTNAYFFASMDVSM